MSKAGLLQTAARGCTLLPGPGARVGRETESGFQTAWSPQRAASQGAGPPVEKGAWERGPQAPLGPKGATARGPVRGQNGPCLATSGTNGRCPWATKRKGGPLAALSCLGRRPKVPLRTCVPDPTY